MSIFDETVSFGGRPVLGIGAVERHNPLPIGRYWVDVFDPKTAEFREWIRRNSDKLKIVSTESFPPSLGYEYPARDWYLFEVISPVEWEGPGLPTIAGDNVHTSDDTVQRPPPKPDPLDQIDPTIPNPMGPIRKAAPWVIGAVVLAGGAYVAYRYRPRERQATRAAS